MTVDALTALNADLLHGLGGAVALGTAIGVLALLLVAVLSGRG